MNDDHIEELDLYLQKINFEYVPIGKKIGLLGNLLKLTNRIREHKTTKIPEWAKGAEFLLNIFDEREKMAEVMRIFKNEQRESIKAFRDMEKVFDEWRLDTGKVRLVSIPSGLDRKTVEIIKDKVCIFTFDAMGKWWEENMTPKRRPFSDGYFVRLENAILEFKSYGIIKYEETSKNWFVLRSMQPIAYYEAGIRAERSGKGIRPPYLKYPHLLMLYQFLKYCNETGHLHIKMDIGKGIGLLSNITRTKIFQDLKEIVPKDQQKNITSQRISAILTKK